jgi:hypothetical protein
VAQLKKNIPLPDQVPERLQKKKNTTPKTPKKMNTAPHVSQQRGPPPPEVPPVRVRVLMTASEYEALRVRRMELAEEHHRHTVRIGGGPFASSATR